MIRFIRYIMTARRPFYLQILLAAVAFISLEGLLQARSEYRFGQSVFNMVKGEHLPSYVFNEELDVMTIRPNAEIGGELRQIRSNSLGLRSPELPQAKERDEFRVAFLGASTMMGTYAPSNEQTCAYRLMDKLQATPGFENTTILNGSIPGAGAGRQANMLENLLLDYEPDALVLYTGVNDLGGMCRKDKSAGPSHRLPRLSLPSWVLTYKLLIEHTVPLRALPSVEGQYLDASDVAMPDYEEGVGRIFDLCVANDLPVIVMLNTKLYREDQSDSEQERRSRNTRYHVGCFDVDGLHTMYHRYNRCLLDHAEQSEALVIDTESLLEATDEFFYDSVHFTSKGEEIVSQALMDVIVSNADRFVR